MNKRRNAQKTALLIALVGLALFGSFYLTQFVEGNAAAQAIISELGYAGAFFVALMFGLSVVVPFPPAALTPVFTATGLYLPIIIATFAIGTVTADLIGYYFGTFSQTLVKKQYPRLFAFIEQLKDSRPLYIFIFVFVISGFVPFPNEAWVVPFGIIGIKLRMFLAPMIAGALVYHTLTAYGVQTLFAVFG